LRGLTGAQGVTGPSVLTPQLILELTNYLDSNSSLDLLNAGQPQNPLVSAIANAAAYRFVAGLYRYLAEKNPNAIPGNGVMDDVLRGTVRWWMGLGGDDEIKMIYNYWSSNFLAAYNGKPGAAATLDSDVNSKEENSQEVDSQEDGSEEREE